jgi:hypothetical protein
MPIQPTRDPQQLLEQLLNFPVDQHPTSRHEPREYLDACLLVGLEQLELVAVHPFPAAAAMRRVQSACTSDAECAAWRQLHAALREAFPPTPEAVRCLDKLGPLESNALHILAMREGGEPVAVRTEALAQLSKLELIRVGADGRPFPLELTPLGLEVWALRQAGQAQARGRFGSENSA